MLKKVLLLILFSITLFAQENNDNNTTVIDSDRFQLIAKSVDNRQGKVVAKGSVVLTTPKYYMMADELYFDRKNEVAELFGDVVIIQNGLSKIFSEYAYIDFKNDINKIDPVLFFSYQNSMWINSKRIDSNPSEHNFDTSTISSCNCDDPAWSMRVSSGTYDTENQWMHLFNMRLYVQGIPFFYLPYFGYPTDQTRRTGILPPTIGYSDDEGLLYAQPIYFAPSDNWDLELTPQHRARRGDGVYATYRYADSQYSTLILKGGTFDELDQYREKYNLKNDEHYGFNISYNRTSIFESGNSNDELSIWLEWMNDIDYRNLDNDNISALGDPTSYGTSRHSYINYYYDTSSWYNGIYFSYYLDTSKEDNGDTLQQLPQYQSHIYTDSFIFDKLTYSTDFIYTNYTREDGITAGKTDLNIPIGYEFSLFDDYLFLKFKEDMTASNIQYGLEEDQYYKDGNYLRSNHQISLSTDLIKPYTNIAHAINFGIDYTIPEVYKKSGDLYGLTSTDGTLSSFSFTESQKTLALNLKQYFYDIETKNLIFSDFLSQSYEYDNDEYVATNLENQLTFNYSLGSISNRLIYNQIDKEIILSSSSFTAAKNSSSIELTHYKTKATPSTSYSDSESMTFDTSINFAKRYTISYAENYDILNKESSKRSYAFKIDEKCWSITLTLEDSLIASATTTSNAKRQDIFYLAFEFKPLGGYQFKQKMDEREE